jgi:ATP-dependent Clp protease ATP-binding subunit ClpA
MPLGRFLIIGPNEKARKLGSGLARFLFGDEQKVLHLDMRDYAEKHQVLRLIGHNGGLVCDWVDGDFSEPIRRQPQLVVLMDGIDKVHRIARDMLIESFQERTMLDGMGRLVSFRQAVFILTTMIGYAEASVRPDCVTGADESESRGYCPQETKEAVCWHFPPDMLRGTFIDDILLFN